MIFTNQIDLKTACFFICMSLPFIFQNVFPGFLLCLVPKIHEAQCTKQQQLGLVIMYQSSHLAFCELDCETDTKNKNEQKHIICWNIKFESLLTKRIKLKQRLTVKQQKLCFVMILTLLMYHYHIFLIELSFFLIQQFIDWL